MPAILLGSNGRTVAQFLERVGACIIGVGKVVYLAYRKTGTERRPAVAVEGQDIAARVVGQVFSVSIGGVGRAGVGDVGISGILQPVEVVIRQAVTLALAPAYAPDDLADIAVFLYRAAEPALQYIIFQVEVKQVVVVRGGRRRARIGRRATRQSDIGTAEGSIVDGLQPSLVVIGVVEALQVTVGRRFAEIFFNQLVFPVVVEVADRGRRAVIQLVGIAFQTAPGQIPLLNDFGALLTSDRNLPSVVRKKAVKNRSPFLSVFCGVYIWNF